MGQFFSRCARSSARIDPFGVDEEEQQQHAEEGLPETFDDLPQVLQIAMAELDELFETEPAAEESLLAEVAQARLMITIDILREEHTFYAAALAPKEIRSVATFRQAYDELKEMEEDHHPRTIGHYRAYFPIDYKRHLLDGFIHFRRIDERPELHEAEPMMQQAGLAIHISIYDPLPEQDDRDANFINGVFITILSLMRFGITRFKVVANHARASLDCESLQKSKIVTIYLKEDEKYLLKSFKERLAIGGEREEESDIARFKQDLQEFWKTVLTSLFDMLASHRIKWGAEIRTDLPIISNTKYGYWRHQEAPRRSVIDPQKSLILFAGCMGGFDKLYLDKLEVTTKYPTEALSSAALRERRDSDSEGSETIGRMQELLKSDELIRQWPYRRG